MPSLRKGCLMMFCTSCGGRVEDGAAFTKCGRLLRGATAPSSGIQASPRAQLVQSTASTAQQAPWGAALLLQNGESVTRYWYADREIGQMATVNGRRRMVKQRIKGYLVLTTQRLAFVRERGILGKSYHIDLSFPIDGLSGLHGRSSDEICVDKRSQRRASVPRQRGRR